MTPKAESQNRDVGSRVLAIRLSLIALWLNLFGARWASYLPSGIPGVRLPEMLLLCGALLGLVKGNIAPPSRKPPKYGLSILVAYIAMRTVETQFRDGVVWSLWFRDMAPFLYLVLLPLLIPVWSHIHEIRLVKTFRSASLALMLIVFSRKIFLQPIALPMLEVPIFAPRYDAEGVVLGLGILAWGYWKPLVPRRGIQTLLFVAAAMNTSRAGFLAALLCALLSCWRERPSLRSAWKFVLPGTTMLLLFAGLLFSGERFSAPQELQASARLFNSSQIGTTNSRILSWAKLVNWSVDENTLLLGAGPGSNSLVEAGVFNNLYIDRDVGMLRYPHSWPLSVIGYHGLIGAITWFGVIALVFIRSPQKRAIDLPIVYALALLVAGSLGVLVESPFGLLPLVCMLAHRVGQESRERGRRTNSPCDNDRVEEPKSISPM